MSVCLSVRPSECDSVSTVKLSARCRTLQSPVYFESACMYCTIYVIVCLELITPCVLTWSSHLLIHLLMLPNFALVLTCLAHLEFSSGLLTCSLSVKDDSSCLCRLDPHHRRAFLTTGGRAACVRASCERTKIERRHLTVFCYQAVDCYIDL